MHRARCSSCGRQKITTDITERESTIVVAYSHENYFLFSLCWIARVLGLFSISVLLLFLFGQGGGLSPITLNDAVGLAFFPFGLIIGLVLAWWKERLGGAIAIGSVVGFYLIYELLINSSWPRGWWFAVFAIPGALFLLYGLLTEARNSSPTRKLKFNKS